MSNGTRTAWRRRRFLVNRRYQLRAIALMVSLVMVLLVFLTLSLLPSSLQSGRQIVQMAPELEQYIKAQDRSMVWLVLLGSTVFLVGVFLVGILETHKTAGAGINIRNRLDDIREGRYGMRLTLRKGDTLRDLESPFNDMCAALEERNEQEIERLERLAEKVDDAAVAAELREMAATKRQSRVGSSIPASMKPR